MNRDELQAAYIEWDLGRMCLEDLQEYFVRNQNLELDQLDDEELTEEVYHYAPELKEDY